MKRVLLLLFIILLATPKAYSIDSSKILLAMAEAEAGVLIHVLAQSSECAGCLAQETSEDGNQSVCSSTNSNNEYEYTACNYYDFDASSTLNGVTLEGSEAVLKTGSDDHSFILDPHITASNQTYFGIMFTVSVDNTATVITLIAPRGASGENLYNSGLAVDGTFFVACYNGTTSYTSGSYSLNTVYYIKTSWNASATTATISVKTDPDAAWPTEGSYYATCTDGENALVADRILGSCTDNNAVYIWDDLRWSDTESDIDYSYK